MAKKKKHRDGLWGLVIDKAEEAADVLSDGKIALPSEEDREKRRGERHRDRVHDDRERDEREEEIADLRDAIKELTKLVGRLDAAQREHDAPEEA